MASTTNKDIEAKVNDLDKKVDSLAQRQDEVLIPGMQEIKEQMQNFAYVPQKDYAKDLDNQRDIDKKQDQRIENLEKMVNAGGVKAANAINTGVGKAIIAIIVAFLLVVIGWSVYKVSPFGGQ